MPDTKISALTAGAPAVATDKIPVARVAGSVNRYLTVSDLIGGTGATSIVFSTSGVPTQSSDLTYNDTTKLFSAQRVTSAGQTFTTDLPVFSGNATLNSAGTTFSGIYRWAIIDPAANAGSAAASIHTNWAAGTGGVTSIMSLSKVGLLTTAAGITTTGTLTINGDAVLSGANRGYYIISNGGVGLAIGASTDTNLSRISAGLWGMGTGAAGSTAGSLSLTNLTATGQVQTPDVRHGSGTLNIYGDTAITFGTNSTLRWSITNAGHFTANTSFDNTYDIGLSGGSRPRTGYFGTSISTPSVITASGNLTLAPNSAITAVTGALTVSTTIKPGGYAIGSLPAGSAGQIVYVTDQITAAAPKGVAPTAGGAIVCAVIYNGAWVGI